MLISLAVADRNFRTACLIATLTSFGISSLTNLERDACKFESVRGCV